MIKLNVGSKFEKEFVDGVIRLNETYEKTGTRLMRSMGHIPHLGE